MKKVKIMLTAVTVLAVVGGALAFKAVGSNTICTSSSDEATCDATPIFNATAQLGTGSPTFYFTVKPVDRDCNQVTCPNDANILDD